MRAILTALLLTIATQAGAAYGKLCDHYWWKTATTADVQAELDDCADVMDGISMAQHRCILLPYFVPLHTLKPCWMLVQTLWSGNK